MKWIKGLNIRPETIELLEENIGRILYDINHSKVLHDPPPRIIEIKPKINKWDLIKLKSFCTAKETINKVKRQLSEWEKRIANETTDKGLTSKTYKQFIQCQRNKQPNQKVAKDLNKHFSKEDTEMANKHTRCSTSLIIREIDQNYSEIGRNGHHQKIHKEQLPERVWRKGNILALLVGMSTDSHYRREYGDSLKKKKNRDKITIQPSNTTSRHIP